MRHLQPARLGQVLLYIAMLAIVVAFMVGLSLCDRRSADTVGAGPMASGGDTVDVGIEYSPLGLYSCGDSVGGYNYDLLHMVAARAHIVLKFHPVVTLGTALSQLRNGIYDLLVMQFPMTRQGREHYLFTMPVYLDQQVLVQRSEAPVTSLFDLAGDTVWVVSGSPMAERMARLSQEIGDEIYVASDSVYGPEQLIMRVLSGEIRFAVVNKLMAQTIDRRLPGLDYSIAVGMTQFQPWVLRKGEQQLCDRLNRGFRAVRSDTTAYYALQRRYFGEVIDRVDGPHRRGDDTTQLAPDYEVPLIDIEETNAARDAAPVLESPTETESSDPEDIATEHVLDTMKHFH